MNRLLDLFLTFARIGGLTFGGGYAMLPILQREVVEKKKWTTEEELMDYYAIGQCTPGVIAVNTATFVGQGLAGPIGGIVATLGVVFPSLIIITVIAAFIQNFAHLAIVQNAFAGIRVCVCVLIFNAVVKLWKKAVVDKPTLVICVLVILGSALTDLSPIVFVIFAAVVGIILKNKEVASKMMILIRLFFEFFKAGLFAIGGGMATLPFLYNISDKTGWFTYGQLADMVAISESTPGPMGVNMATYVGFTTAGPVGAVIATLGLITPSIIVILIIAGFLKAFKTNKYVQNAFYGLRPASTGLIAAAGLSVLSLVLLHKDAFAASGKITDLISIRSIVLLVVLYYFTAICKKQKDISPGSVLAVPPVTVVLRFGGV